MLRVYKNTRTGQTVTTVCSCAGEDIVEITPVQAEKPQESGTTAKPKASRAKK